jgi:hypothetical protein
LVLKQWANYLISEVSYDKNHLISIAKRHEDTEKGITNGKFVDRIKISSDILPGKKGKRFTFLGYMGNHMFELIKIK